MIFYYFNAKYFYNPKLIINKRKGKFIYVKLKNKPPTYTFSVMIINKTIYFCNLNSPQIAYKSDRFESNLEVENT